jgi:hypothetical protein
LGHTLYIIKWGNTPSEQKTVSSDEFSYTIEDLDACEEHEISVRAVNAKGEGADAAKQTTETAGNYHTHIILLYL